MNDEIRELERDTQQAKVSLRDAVLTTEGVPFRTGQSPWRHPLFILMIGALLVMLFSTVVSGSAFFVVRNLNVELVNEQQCNRPPAANVDEKLGLAVSSLANGLATTLDGLDDLRQGEPILEGVDVDSKITEMTSKANALIEATQARTAAIETCKPGG